MPRTRSRRPPIAWETWKLLWPISRDRRQRPLTTCGGSLLCEERDGSAERPDPRGEGHRVVGGVHTHRHPIAASRRELAQDVESIRRDNRQAADHAESLAHLPVLPRCRCNLSYLMVFLL